MVVSNMGWLYLSSTAGYSQEMMPYSSYSITPHQNLAVPETVLMHKCFLNLSIFQLPAAQTSTTNTSRLCARTDK